LPKEGRPLDLRPEKLTRTVVTLATPAVVENLLVTAVFFVDTLLIGWLHDDTALAAVGLGSTVMFAANGLFEALAVSATALVARSCGEGDFQQAGRVAGQSLGLSLLLSAGLMALLMPLAWGFLSLLGAEPAVVQAGGLYLRLILSTSFGVACLRLVVVYLFAVTLGWGLAGVWWGTAVDWAGRSALIWALFRRGRWKEVRV